MAHTLDELERALFALPRGDEAHLVGTTTADVSHACFRGVDLFILESVAVSPPARRQGHMRDLVDVIERVALDRGAYPAVRLGWTPFDGFGDWFAKRGYTGYPLLMVLNPPPSWPNPSKNDYRPWIEFMCRTTLPHEDTT